MKKTCYLLFIISLFISCSSNNNENLDNPNAEIIKNIINFTTNIVTPIQKRDYSYYNNGYEGIFESPDSTKIFNGDIKISYKKNSVKLKPSDIQIIWRSSIDGILFQGNPDFLMQTKIEKKLSKGIHTLFLEVSVIGQNLTVKDSIKLSNSIQLKTENTGKSVLLNWSKYEGNDFVSYKIYSEDFIPIAEIKDQNTLEYNHTVFSSLVEEKKYQIIVETNGSYDHIIGSNIESMHPGIFIDFPYYVSKIIKDPSRDRMYALVGNKNSESDVYGLLLIDINSQTFKINAHLLKSEIFADFDISPDGQYLFLCQERVEKITKFNLDTFEVTSFATNTNQWGIHKIEVGTNNILYCHKDPPTSGTTSFWLYDGNNGSEIASETGFTEHGDIEFNVFNNKLYAAQSNGSSTIYRFSNNNNKLSLDKINEPYSYRAYPFVFLAPDSQKIFWEKFELDLDLNIVRTLNTSIKACSPNNNYLADVINIYNYSDVSVNYKFKGLPVGNSMFNSLVFSDDTTLIYAQANQSNIRYAPDPYWRAQTYIFKFETE